MNPSAAFFCLCMVAVYSAGEKTSKTKRDVSGLYPFPRVGRGDVAWTSQFAGPREMKRQGLILFPRVGKSGGEDNPGKKRELSETGGMWFGPRLGRLQKKSHRDEDNWALVPIGDLELTGQGKENFGAKLGAESFEEADRGKDYRI